MRSPPRRSAGPPDVGLWAQLRARLTSLSFWSVVAALVGLVLRRVGAGADVAAVAHDPEVQAALGDLLTTLGIGDVLAGVALVLVGVTRARGDPSTASATDGPLRDHTLQVQGTLQVRIVRDEDRP